MNTFLVDYLQFYIQIGGTNSLLCNGGILRRNSVLVQYSNDGGISWHLMRELTGMEYDSPKLVTSLHFRLIIHANVS